MNNLNSRLKKLREKNNLSIAEVARRLGVSPSTYREWEYGRKIKGEPYLKLAEVFEVSLVYLMMGTKHDVEIELCSIEESLKKIRSFL